jgi:formylglycine-generating enzyme required for sulfatase activity
MICRLTTINSRIKYFINFINYVFFIILLLSACYEPSALDPSSVCHPEEPQCAMLDYDGDGVLNGIDEFPLDANCHQLNEDNCGTCGRRCDIGMYCSQEYRCIPRPPEICDGLDNDYDQVVDEELIAPRSELWQGVCIGLSKVCQNEQGWQEPFYEELELYEKVEGVCDGIDNDCDGRVDEELQAPFASIQLGICQGIRAECMGTMGWQDPIWEQSISQYEVIERQCDGLDNDCDGLIDESLDGDPCVTGRLGICQGGSKQCIDGMIRCEAQYEERIEICDGLDNDCDGEIDEEVEPPLLYDAIGVCRQQIQYCRGIDGWILAPIEQLDVYETIEQLCDGVDNDCDGEVDENIIPQACEISTALGPCSIGVSKCISGALLCVSESQVSLELCDGLDNDCDGVSDEDLQAVLYQEQRGVCQGLKKVCEGSLGWQDPDLSRITHYEVEEMSCDGLDNDCDGYSDESLNLPACEGGGVGQCRWGSSICQAGQVSCLLPQSSTESCDGVDNDCDGQVDEALIPPQASSYLGVCAGRVQICRGAEGWEDPLPIVIGYEIEEISCDGLDNDCDGQVDEGLQGSLMIQQTGVCEGSRQICNGSLGWENFDFNTLNNYQLAENRCDGLDNDCDGQIDENSPNDACQSSFSGLCQAGHWSCQEGDLLCEPNQQPRNESCDGIDNDCDGQIDESLQDGICAIGTGACLRESVIQCVNGNFECVGQAGQGNVEECNGIDDDCDTQIDEESQFEGLTCANGVGACQRQGLWTCQLGVLSCNVSAGVATQETCDGIDNDCDTRVDETFVQLGRFCSIGEGECAVQNTWRCGNNAQLQCGQDIKIPLAEQCDDLDNDCDGLTDEHAGPEICDALDNDCDGLIDEGIGEEICDTFDNDCDGYVDESPCTICQENCPEIEWFRIPGGDFLMGSLDQEDQQPIHSVRIKSFDASQEITVAQYQACVNDAICTPTQTGGSCNAGQNTRQNDPINCINWYQAQVFAYWMGARLPSESQWEYMARNTGNNILYPWGNLAVDCTWAHVAEQNTFGCGLLSSTTRCHYPQGNSAQGLCDLIGNVAEWVLDDYQPHYQNANDQGEAYCSPTLGCAPQGDKVYRGGGWRTRTNELNSHTRFHALYFLRDANVGFRVIRSGQADSL